MKLLGSSAKCFVCETPLTMWHSHTCTRCGKPICSRHAHLLKYRRSHVLYSICTCCSYDKGEETPIVISTSAPKVMEVQFS